MGAVGRSFRSIKAYNTAKVNLAIPQKNVAAVPPVWLKAIESIPPSEILTRPRPVQHHDPDPKHRRPKGIFKPQQIVYPEDELRRTFFKDHPWELARPRVIVELDGMDGRECDWSKGLSQPGMPVTGEAVVQRQLWLMENEGKTKEQAYDESRREFYLLRQEEDMGRRIAQEEARMVGGYFGKSRLQIGMQLEDAVYEKWKLWAQQESQKIEAEHSAMYVSFGNEQKPPGDDDSFRELDLAATD